MHVCFPRLGYLWHLALWECMQRCAFLNAPQERKGVNRAQFLAYYILKVAGNAKNLHCIPSLTLHLLHSESVFLFFSQNTRLSVNGKVGGPDVHPESVGYVVSSPPVLTLTILSYFIGNMYIACGCSAAPFA